MAHDHKLDERAQKLAEENRFLVHFTIRRYIQENGRLNEDDISDGYAGLCQAAATYDPAKGEFSSYAIRCILNALIRRMVFRNRVCRHAKDPIVSLNELVYTYDGDGEEAIQLIEDMDTDVERDALDSIMREQRYIEPYWQEVPVHDAVIREGKTLVQIAAERGRCKQRLSQIKKWEAEKFRHKHDFSELMEVFA